MISINLYEIVMQMVNFLILLFLLNKFLIKPLSEFMDKRSKDIQDNIEAATRSKSDAENLLEEQKTVLKTARVEAKEIRDKAEHTAKIERERMMTETKKEAQNVLGQAKKEVDLAMGKAKKELMASVGELSVQLSETILKRKLDHGDKEKLVSEGLKKLSVS